MATYQKTVFVTGASAGFGTAIVRRFAAGGARVVACARRADRLASLADELSPAILPLELDVRDRIAVSRAIDDLPSEFSTVRFKGDEVRADAVYADMRPLAAACQR